MKVGIKEKILKLDANLTERIRAVERPGLLRTTAILFAHSGDSWFWLLGLGLLWLLGNETGKATALTMALGILITAAIVFVLKFTIRRQRPEGDWGGIYRKTDPHSFPSGHAARAMMLAVVALGLGPAWFAVLLVVWTPLVILARVAMGVHYLSDVLAGALVGVGTGILVLQLYPYIGAL
jgi:undecaprenyl-diphosphatase